MRPTPSRRLEFPPSPRPPGFAGADRVRASRAFAAALALAAAVSLSAQPGGPGPAAAVEPAHRDVPYAAASQAQKMDIYLPARGTVDGTRGGTARAAGPFPVIAAIHGGAFMAGDKADGQLLPMLKGLERGYAVVSLNYRLSGEAAFPAPIQDVKAAIRFLRAAADSLGLDGDRIAVWGGSAGGYLAALAGTSGGVTEFEDPGLGNPYRSSRVRAVVDWFGPVDFAAMDAQFTRSGAGRPDHSQAGSPESRLMGGALAEITDRLPAANPEIYISPDDPPFLIQHGDGDPLIPVEQSIHFQGELEKILGKEKARLDVLPGAGHGGPAFGAAANVDRVLDFLDRWLKGG